jgi:hypothetical protein
MRRLIFILALSLSLGGDGRSIAAPATTTCAYNSIASFTDSTTQVWGATVVHGGKLSVLAWCDATGQFTVMAR